MFSATNNPNGVPSACFAAVLVAEAEARLLASVVLRPHHVLRPLFPPVTIRRPGLRPRPHNFVLPDKDDCNFIPRILYRTLLQSYFTPQTLSLLDLTGFLI